MRTGPAIFCSLLLASACATASPVDCLSGPVAITSSLVIPCFDNTFDFGQDLKGNPANPLPLGGSIILKDLIFTEARDGSFAEWDLDFGFPNPSIRTTQLDFSIFGGLDSPRSGVSFLGLGSQRGTNFLINETETNLFGGQAELSVCSSSTLCQSQTQVKAAWGKFEHISTTITDNAGDLAGFSESFAVPEPRSWMLLVSGLLVICAGSRIRKQPWASSHKQHFPTRAERAESY
jgi:hypothetical protein